MPDVREGEHPQVSSPDITDTSENGGARHVAIIMDGNNRWAKQRSMASIEGHRAGAKALRAVVEQCVRQGVEALTVFAFSSENWRRPPAEVRGLMELFIQALRDEVPKLYENDIAVRFIGDLTLFEPDLQAAMAEANALTAQNQRLVLSVAVNYGGRWDVAHAAKSLAQAVASGERAIESIDEHALAPYLALSDLPDVDLCIRTGGEQRISNFLLWQLAYAELYFSDLYWPDFDGAALAAALKECSQRQRRFGRTGDQVTQFTQTHAPLETQQKGVTLRSEESATPTVSFGGDGGATSPGGVVC